MDSAKETKTTTSGLEYKLHPLVLINITDHYNRTRANSEASTSGQRVLGVLLGQQHGRVVDISNSFELSYTVVNGAPLIDQEFFTLKATQYKQVFKDLEAVGWYATAPPAAPGPAELAVQRMLVDVNEAPVLLILDPTINHTRRDLPVTLYETELHGAEHEWVVAPYALETSEAERIGVDQVAKIVPAGRTDAASQLTAHTSTLHSATKMLRSRVHLVQQVVKGMADGSIPRDHALLRRIGSLVNSMPALDGRLLAEDLNREHADSLLVLLLSSTTKSGVALSDVLDKFYTAFDKPKRKTATGGW